MKSYSDDIIKKWAESFAGIYSTENESYRQRFRMELDDRQRALFDLETARLHLKFEKQIHGCIRESMQMEMFREPK